jgi:death-on-curing protein
MTAPAICTTAARPNIPAVMTLNRTYLGSDDARAIHAETLAAHGAAPAACDARLLDSAIQAPINLAAYGSPDMAALAAAYAFGIVRDRPFAEGNQRTAAALAKAFVTRNGHHLAATDTELAASVDTLAAGSLNEGGLAEWFRARVAPSGI